MNIGGKFKVHRYDRETGAYLGTVEKHNAITTAGRDLFIALNMGNNTSDYFTNANSIIEITTSSGTENISGASADSGFPDHSTEADVVWQWSDISPDTYTIDTIRMRQGSLTGTIFSEVTGGPFGDNSKPSTQNWIYEYTLGINSVDASFDSTGLDYWLRIMTNDFTDGTWDGLVQHVEDGSGNVAVSQKGANGGTTISGGNIEWIFNYPAGTNDNFAWEVIEFYGAWAGFTIPGQLLSTQTEGLGTKGANEEWEYTYTISIALA